MYGIIVRYEPEADASDDDVGKYLSSVVSQLNSLEAPNIRIDKITIVHED